MWIGALAVLFALPALAQPIQRSQAEVRAFKRANACPSTGKHRGPCPGWNVEHPIALCAGGEDNHRTNMAWLSIEDHHMKTFVDTRECRKLKKMAETPAVQPSLQDSAAVPQ